MNELCGVVGVCEQSPCFIDWLVHCVQYTHSFTQMTYWSPLQSTQMFIQHPGECKCIYRPCRHVCCKCEKVCRFNSIRNHERSIIQHAHCLEEGKMCMTLLTHQKLPHQPDIITDSPHLHLLSCQRYWAAKEYIVISALIDLQQKNKSRRL